MPESIFRTIKVQFSQYDQGTFTPNSRVSELRETFIDEEIGATEDGTGPSPGCKA